MHYCFSDVLPTKLLTTVENRSNMSKDVLLLEPSREIEKGSLRVLGSSKKVTGSKEKTVFTVSHFIIEMSSEFKR